MRLSKDRLAEIDILAIEMATRALYAEYGVLPSSTSWFEELATPSNATINTRRIIFLDLAGNPNDPWGTPYHYTHPSAHGTNLVDVWSSGKDKMSNSAGDDADDINSWNRERPWRTHPSYQARTLHIDPWFAGILIFLVIAGVLIVKDKRAEQSR